MEKSLGQYLQEWLILNKVSITDTLFADAVDLTIENAIRDSHRNDVKTNSPVPNINANGHLS